MTRPMYSVNAPLSKPTQEEAFVDSVFNSSVLRQLHSRCIADSLWTILP